MYNLTMNTVTYGAENMEKNRSIAIIVPGLMGYAQEAHIVSLANMFLKSGIPCITFTPSTL